MTEHGSPRQWGNQEWGKESSDQREAIEAQAQLIADFTSSLFSTPELNEQLSSSDATMMLFVPKDNPKLADVTRQVGMNAEQKGETVMYIQADKRNARSTRYDSFSIQQSGQTRSNVNAYEQGNTNQAG